MKVIFRDCAACEEEVMLKIGLVGSSGLYFSSGVDSFEKMRPGAAGCGGRDEERSCRDASLPFTTSESFFTTKLRGVSMIEESPLSATSVPLRLGFRASEGA